MWRRAQTRPTISRWRGAANLSGTVLPVVAGGTRLKPGTVQYNVLTATGGVTQNGV